MKKIHSWPIDGGDDTKPPGSTENGHNADDPVEPQDTNHLGDDIGARVEGNTGDTQIP